MAHAVVREAGEKDLPVILAIHNAAATDTTSLWDVDPGDLYDRVECQQSGVTDGWPVLVAEWDATIAGYASYGPWRHQAGYTHTVEISLFVDEQYRRRGIGGALLDKLVARARKADLHVMLAGIESSNTAAVSLHEKVGFQIVAQMPEVGWKFDRWLDLTLMQLTIRESLLSRVVHGITGI
jgi:phosphinothricin acetyltransferase